MNRYIFLHILPSQLSAKGLLASACKQLQALSLQVPDSRFKIQDFQGLFLNPGAWIQDSRSKKNFLNPTSWLQRGVARVWICFELQVTGRVAVHQSGLARIDLAPLLVSPPPAQAPRPTCAEVQEWTVHPTRLPITERVQPW